MSCVTCKHFVEADLNFDGDAVIECNRIGCFEHILEKDAVNCPDYQPDIDKEAEMAIKKEYTKTVVVFDPDKLKCGMAVRLKLGNVAVDDVTAVRSSITLYTEAFAKTNTVDAVISGYTASAPVGIQILTILPGKADRHLFWVSIDDILRGYLDLEVL